MVAQSFEVGDLVWAKMKGFCHWPGKIFDPPQGKVKKNHHYVLFFGTENYAWISDDCIVLHNEEVVKDYGTKKKTAAFLSAVYDIVRESKKSSKYQKHESSIEKLTSKDASPKISNVSKNVKRKVPVKKIVRKRDLDEAESSRFSVPSKLMKYDYASLFANIPPNIGYNGGAPSTQGLLSRNAYVNRPETPPIDFKSENDILKQRDIQPTSKKIGFLGLGKLGQGIVKNLLQSGHSVTIWNRTTEKCKPFINIGAKEASTPLDVVIASDITFCCVSDTDAAKGLVFGNCGILQGLENCSGQNKGYVEMTSMDPRTSQDIAEEVRSKGGRYLEAPLSGSRLQAMEGNMFILGAGDKSLFDDCESCFNAIARDTFFVTTNVGSAIKYNIGHSMLIGNVYAALAESLALMKRNGLDEREFLNIVLQYGVLDGKVITDKGMVMVENEYTSNTPLKHVQKDLNLAIVMATSCHQPLPITAATNEVYKRLKMIRYGDHDVSAIYEGTKG